MAKSTRRDLMKVAAAGGVSAALGLTIKPASEARAEAGPQHDHGLRYLAFWLRQLSALGSGRQARR